MSIVDDKFFVHFAKCGAKELDAASAMVGVELDDGLRGVVLHDVTEMTERLLIVRALTHTNNNRTHAAKLLEISHRALMYKLKEYDIT